MIKSILEQAEGAGTVRQPIRLDSRLKVPGTKAVRVLDLELSEKLMANLEQRLTIIREAEFADLRDDWDAVVSAVGSSLSLALPLDLSHLLDMQLEPDRLQREIRSRDPDRVRIIQLSADGQAAYDRMLDETCRQIVEFFTSRPEFSKRVDVELIRRTGTMSKQVDRIEGLLTVKPDNGGFSDFEQRYSEMVIEKLDRLQLFGVTLGQESRYPLSTAYLSLCVVRETGSRGRRRHLAAQRPRLQTLSSEIDEVPFGEKLRAPEALVNEDRLLVRGEAGSGKTTLLQWLAIESVRNPREGNDAESMMPFFIPLRRFVGKEPPKPEGFLDEISPILSEEAPPGWVRYNLKTGRALVLIDGVDELPGSEREIAREWLRDLIRNYPTAKYVLTSRPPAAHERWLAQEGFVALQLLPMGQADVQEFVHHWHESMRQIARTHEERANISEYERDLVDKLASRRDLRRLARIPLLAALVCSLHLDRFTQLPRDRIGLYRAALEMLLVRRDEARGIVSSKSVPLSQEDQEILLGRLAYWLIRNGRSDVDRVTAISRINQYCKSMPHISTSAGDILDHLLLRSGVLREPADNTVDFLHRTFQEYLAAKAILDEDDLDGLIDNGHEDQWREVVVMAVGQGRRTERERIVRALVERGDERPSLRRRLHLLAAACLDHATMLEPSLHEEVRRRAARLIPPRQYSEVADLVKVGELLFDLVPDPTDLTEDKAKLLLRAIQEIGGEESLPVLARFARSPHKSIRESLATRWLEADPDEYVRIVLRSMDLSGISVRVDSVRQYRAATTLQSMERLVALKVDDLEPLTAVNSLEELRIVNPSPGVNLSPLREMRGLKILLFPLVQGLRAEDLAALKGCQIERLALTAPGPWTPSGDTRDYFSFLHHLPHLESLSLAVPFHTDVAAVISGTKIRRLSLSVANIFARRALVGGDSYLVSFLSTTRNVWEHADISDIRSLPYLDDVSMSGWPTVEELDSLSSLPALRALTLFVPSTLEGQLELFDGHEYANATIGEGAQEVLRRVPSLARLRLYTYGVRDPENSFRHQPQRVWGPRQVSDVERSGLEAVAREVAAGGVTIELCGQTVA